MEGRCQLTAKQAMSKCGQNANKGVTMAISHGSPPTGTCHTEFSVEIRSTYLGTGPTMNQEEVGGGKPKTKQNHEGKTAQQWHNYAFPGVATIRWVTADLPVNSHY